MWIAAAVLGIWRYFSSLVAAVTDVYIRFDDGIQSTTITYLLHGQLPFTDFYEPYGIGLGVPGILPRLLGFDGVFAERLTYAVFPALATALATIFVWRRCGALLGMLVGFVSLSSAVARYSMAWVAVFGFALLIDAAVNRTSTGTLRSAAREQATMLLAASAVLSLAAWARVEYAAFGVVWAVVLLLALGRSRTMARLAAATVGMALMPTVIVVVTGGLRHLWWFTDYILSTSSSGFRAQRGQPIQWGLLQDRISELAHLHLKSGDPGAIVASYGIACVVVVLGLASLVFPRTRARVLRGDPTFLTPFFLVVAILVLNGQIVRFSSAYGLIGVPVFWVAGALFVRRLPVWAVAVVTLLVAWPLLVAQGPGALRDRWRARPPTTQREAIPGMNRIPVPDDGSAESMASLVALWDRLGLRGRPTVSVGRRNDVAWVNDAVVGFLVDAPSAGWPLTYDPGLANEDRVQGELTAALCRNRAPVVQYQNVYPYPSWVNTSIGSHRLDEFLAVNYHLIAVAGFYRILTPQPGRCQEPESLDPARLARLRNAAVERGDPPQAGALALARIAVTRRRGLPIDTDDVAVAALGGQSLDKRDIPPAALGDALRVLVDGRRRPGLAGAAARRWPTDLQALAVESAWVLHRIPGEPSEGRALRRVAELVAARPRWPSALGNARAVLADSPARMRRLGRAGARGIPDYDAWRREAAARAGDLDAAVAAGVDVVNDLDRLRDPVHAGHEELALAGLPGLEPGCVSLLRHHADTRPGVWVPGPPDGARCPRPRIVALANDRFTSMR